jgi:hypothetical protein
MTRVSMVVEVGPAPKKSTRGRRSIQGRDLLIEPAVQPGPEGIFRLCSNGQAGEWEVYTPQELDLVLGGRQQDGGSTALEGFFDAGDAGWRVGMVVRKGEAAGDFEVELSSRLQKPLGSRNRGEQQHPSTSWKGLTGSQSRWVDAGRSAESWSFESKAPESLGESGARCCVFSTQEDGVCPAGCRQRLAQASTREKTSTGEGIVGGENQQIDVPEKSEVREAVVEDEDLGSGIQAFQRVSASVEAIGSDHHRYAGQSPGQQHRFVSGDLGPEQGALAGADDAHTSSSTAVAPREYGCPQAAISQVAGDGGYQRSLAGSSPMQVANADNGSRQPLRSHQVPAPACSVSCAIELLPG